MADAADDRMKALKASMKEALGKLTGSDELEAQGVRERVGRAVPSAKAPAKKRAPHRAARPAKKRA